MKHLIVLAVLTALHLPILAQETTVARFFDHLRQFDSEISLTLEGPMLQTILSAVEDEDGLKFLEKITKVQIMTFEKAPKSVLKDVRRVVTDLQKESFQQVLQLREENTDVEVWAQASEDLITQAFLYVQTDTETICIGLEGSFSPEDLKDSGLQDAGKRFLPKGKA